MLKTALVAMLFVVMCVMMAGCGGGGNEVVTPPAGVPAGGVIVTDNLTMTMSFNDVQKLPRGAQLYVRLNRSGYEVREYPCTFVSAFTDSGMRLIECQMPSTITVGEGDSGSPVVYQKSKTDPKQVIGALAYGYMGNEKDFFAKSISDMNQINGYVGTASMSNRRPIGLALQCNASDHAVSVMKSLGHGNDQFISTSSARQTVNTCGGVPESAPAIAGQSVSVDYIRGDLVNGGAVGTLTFLQPDGKWLCFGHPMDFAGQRALPVSLATMDAMIDTILGSFKQARPTKEPLGALVQDRQQGCMIDPTATPTTSPLDVTATVNGHQSKYHHDLARDHGSSNELSFYSMAITSSLDAALGQIAKLASSGTVTIKFEGAAPVAFDIATPDGIINQTPNDASGQVTQSVMMHIYDWTGDPANFGKGLESLTINVTFSNWTPPTEEPGKG